LHYVLPMPAVVSVIIPCYNQAHFLSEAIESALAQTYRPLEIVVVDDGATDSTFEVATAYAEARCVRQPNQGLAAARNAGLRASRGEYVVFLDADDRLLAGALHAGAAVLDAHPDAAFTAGRHRRIAADGSPLPVLHRPRIERDHYVSLVHRCWIAMPAVVMHRRSVLEAVGAFDTTLACAEDYDLYLRLARRFPIVDHYAEVAEYRQHPGTISRNAERMLSATLAVLAPHRPGVNATLAHRRAWRQRDNAVWYYDRLLDAARDDLAQGRWPAAARGLLVFARYLPRHPTYAWRRLVTPLRRMGRALRRRVAEA
jgi:glycosyltransferase involved in cell wall biosynthesis